MRLAKTRRKRRRDEDKAESEVNLSTNAVITEDSVEASRDFLPQDAPTGRRFTLIRTAFGLALHCVQTDGVVPSRLM